MIETIIRYIVIAILLGIIGEVISHLSSSKTTDENISTIHYRVKAPAVLKYACMSQFILGLIMFLVFSYFYLKGNETVEMGHLYVSSIFGAIGLYGVAWASVWGVKVDDSQLEIHRIFHTKKVLFITDIGQVIIDKKDAMILYDKMGKKLIKIDALSDNYDYLLNLLKSQNIKILNKHLKKGAVKGLLNASKNHFYYNRNIEGRRSYVG